MRPHGVERWCHGLCPTIGHGHPDLDAGTPVRGCRIVISHGDLAGLDGVPDSRVVYPMLGCGGTRWGMWMLEKESASSQMICEIIWRSASCMGRG